ncbi:peptide chain release factor N(5)-glutamine methyltransferase [Chelatococcus daeguensis]|nr:protein-(glutamine-N5) methyltransferase, release factor-specific [Chelatococcus daeguensis]MBM3082065.1 peptide chain release factor N(5)-glutamine methyltransferase [Chelatococcus daeguensis]
MPAPVPPLMPTTTRQEALRHLRASFAAAGIDNPALDARLLLLAACEIAGAELAANPTEPLGEDGAKRLVAVAARRLAREPVARILGEREFWGLPFRLSPATLEPRPDTETLVAAVLKTLRAQGRADAPLTILDIGVGSGCILLALLHELPQATGLGIDRALEAAQTARGNAERLGLAERARFIVGNWSAAVAGPIDILVSNPPYIASAVIPGLAPEVRRYDPLLALDGGGDGLDAYRALAADAPRLLAQGGLAALEVGAGQDGAVAGLFAGLGPITVHADLAGIARAVVVAAAG